MMKIFTILTTIALFLVTVESTEYKHHLTLKPGVFDVYWSVNTTRKYFETFSFKFVAKTTGWAALGWSKTPNGNKMIQYDIGLGGVKDGSGYLKDYWSWSLGKPEIDQRNQNLNLVSASEAGGFTTIEFTRPADTSDSATADVPLENGTRIWLMWAIADTDATDPETFVKHSDRGYTKVAYNMFTGEQFEAPSTATSPSTASPSTASPSTASPTKPTGSSIVATTPSTTKRSVTSTIGTIHSEAIATIASLNAVVLIQLGSMLFR